MDENIKKFGKILLKQVVSELSKTEVKVGSKESIKQVENMEEVTPEVLPPSVNNTVLDNTEEGSVALTNIAQGIVGLMKFREEQKLKHKQVEIQRDIIIKQINTKKEIFLVYLNKYFKERRNIFQKLFNNMDVAINKDDQHQLAMLLNTIVEVSKDTPFKVLADLNKTTQSFQDPDHKWEF